MMTIEQAKEAVELSDERKSLIDRANKIRMADDIHFGAELKPTWPRRETVTFEVEQPITPSRAGGLKGNRQRRLERILGQELGLHEDGSFSCN